MKRRRRPRHPSDFAWGEYTDQEREALTIPTEVWDRIRRPTDAEARAARRRRTFRMSLTSAVGGAWGALIVAVPAGLTFARWPWWVYTPVSAATVGAVTVTAWVFIEWAYRRWPL